MRKSWPMMAMMALVVLATVAAVVFVVLEKERKAVEDIRQAEAPAPAPASEQAQPPAETRMTVAPAEPPVENATAAPAAEAPAPAMAGEEALPPLPEGEDPVVTRSFLQDLVGFAVAHTWPGGSLDREGQPFRQAGTSLSVQAVNLRYGTNLTGFAFSTNDVEAARREILDHVLASSALDSIFRLYAERLARTLAAEFQRREYPFPGLGGKGSHSRGASPAEAAAMLRVHAPLVRGTAATLRGMASRPDLLRRFTGYFAAAERAEEANKDYLILLIDDVKGQKKETKQAQQFLRRALEARDRARAGVVDVIREAGGPAAAKFDETFYVAAWAWRRVKGDKSRLPVLAKAGERLDDLADRLEANAARLERKAKAEAEAATVPPAQ